MSGSPELTEHPVWLSQPVPNESQKPCFKIKDGQLLSKDVEG